MSISVVEYTTEEAHAELARLLRLLPYSIEEMEERAILGELRPSELSAYVRIGDLRFLLGEEDHRG